MNEPNLDDLDVSVHSHSFKHLDAGSNDDGDGGVKKMIGSR